MCADFRQQMAQPRDRLGLIPLALVIYLPFLQNALGTFSLSPTDWIIVAATAISIFPVLELAKWMGRRHAALSTSLRPG